MHALPDSALGKSLRCHLSWQVVGQGVASVLRKRVPVSMPHQAEASWILGKTFYFTLRYPQWVSRPCDKSVRYNQPPLSSVFTGLSHQPELQTHSSE